VKQFVVVLGLAGLLCILLVTVSTGQRKEFDPSTLAVDSKLYKACGLDRLTDDERSNLYRTFQSRPSRSYLEESAVRYVEREKFDELEIYGTIELQLGIDLYPKPYLIAYGNGKSYLLETGLTQQEFPMPGLYFGKIEGSRWRIIEKRGEVVDYWIKESGD
jgi:hypothetical protein